MVKEVRVVEEEVGAVFVRQPTDGVKGFDALVPSEETEKVGSKGLAVAEFLTVTDPRVAWDGVGSVVRLRVSGFGFRVSGAEWRA